jgi:small subunit ribosomal protein S18
LGRSPKGFILIVGLKKLEEATGSLAKMRRKTNRRKAKAKTRTARKDPLYVDGERPRPMYVDYKDVELLKKLINRHGKIVGRRKTGCTAISQHAVTESIKRARFMALLPFKGD